MSKAERTRQFIIEQSAQVFNRKGYAATTLSDIIEATGLTKGAIYGNFENREEVAVAVYLYNIQRINGRLTDAMKTASTAKGKLMAFIGYYRTSWQQVFERGGCPLLNASVEADDHADFLRKHVQQTVKGWAKGIMTIIDQGRENGEFKKNLDTKKYAYLLMTLLEGGIMLGKISEKPDRLFIALDQMEKIIETDMKK